jgi:uncharacterized protein YbjT (DUF2867 family)
MTDNKIIAVVGATGATAGGLARAILDDPDRGYALRAITRTPDSAAARALADRGATVVRADSDDENSLVRAFDGAYAAFCMTNFFEHFSAEREAAQAANLGRAAGAAGVRHAIWSTAEDTRQWYPLDDGRMPTLQGRFKVPQWDAKSEGDSVFTASGVPTTFLLTPFHWESFVFGLGAPERGEDGVLTLAMPLGNALLPGIAAEDIGRCAYGILRAGDAFIGKTVGIAGEHLTGERLAAGLSKLAGEPVRYQHVPVGIFRSLPIPGIDIGANMFQFVTEANADYCSRRDVALARSLNVSIASFDDWIEATRAQLPEPARAR